MRITYIFRKYSTETQQKCIIIPAWERDVHACDVFGFVAEGLDRLWRIEVGLPVGAVDVLWGLSVSKKCNPSWVIIVVAIAVVVAVMIIIIIIKTIL